MSLPVDILLIPHLEILTDLRDLSIWKACSGSKSNLLPLISTSSSNYNESIECDYNKSKNTKSPREKLTLLFKLLT